MKILDSNPRRALQESYSGLARLPRQDAENLHPRRGRSLGEIGLGGSGGTRSRRRRRTSFNITDLWTGVEDFVTGSSFCLNDALPPTRVPRRSADFSP